MKWNIEESKHELPNIVIANYIDDFSKATDGLLDLVIAEFTDIKKLSSNISTTFQFSVSLVGEKLTGYIFEVFKFGYNADIYPVDLYVEARIGKELGMQEEDFLGRHYTAIDNEKNLTIFIEAIFNTEQFNKVVGGILKISKEK